LIFRSLPLIGAYEIKLEFVQDERGSFARNFCMEEFADKGLETKFVQHSLSVNKFAGTLRGLHFQQDPFSEVKLVTCTAGEAFDVIVDIRPNSETFGSWHGITISDQERSVIYIPKGFAHGFQSLKDNTVISYQISTPHHPEFSSGIHWNDPSLNIDWPLDLAVILDKDQLLPGLAGLT
jgi:dTDP-4-dehydrorhamnose 3,5-epimerase